MALSTPKQKTVTLKIVGGTNFGIYPKISREQTLNMIISDTGTEKFLVDYAGYKKVAEIINNASGGRGIYTSKRFNHIILVIDNGVYIVNDTLSASKVATIETFEGDVFMAENNGGQIAICDKKNIYIYNYKNNTFQVADLDFLPGYVAFQDTRFVSVDQLTATWRLSLDNDGLTWPSILTGEFQTKADNVVAAVPIPGKGSLLFIFGNIVTESWYDTGQQLFPYQKNTFSDTDYGCLNASTIAFADKFVVWLGGNENSTPVIMVSSGGDYQQISTEGLDFKFSQLTAPEDCYGFLFKQNGHLIYQFTFVTDNLSYIYDFKTKQFFTVSDEHQNYHIAKKIVLFNNKYYFISFKDGNLYEFSSEISTYDGAEIPRIRVCPPLRLPSSERIVVNNLSFPIEQGVNRTLSRVDVSVSDDGGETFSNTDEMEMNEVGHRKSQFIYYGLGATNDMTIQLRFWSQGRFAAADGEVSFQQ